MTNHLLTIKFNLRFYGEESNIRNFINEFVYHDYKGQVVVKKIDVGDNYNFYFTNIETLQLFQLIFHEYYTIYDISDNYPGP